MMPDEPAPFYPASPGHKENTTSLDAAESMRRAAPRLRTLVLKELRRAPGTADELAERVGQTILSIRPRLSELQRLGLARDTGARRPNISGRMAKVFEA
jgi:predicted ArsR family transcriptional regulator